MDFPGNKKALVFALLIFARFIFGPPAVLAQSDQANGSEKQSTTSESSNAAESPTKAITRHTLQAADDAIRYTATAASLIISDDQNNPVGEIFYTAYQVNADSDQNNRPLTFVFNGGPGAASAYLHLGAMGPVRVIFEADGRVALPVRLVENQESWLAFTDLVFVDPIGTGYSRAMTSRAGGQSGAPMSGSRPPNGGSDQSAWGIAEDTDILAEFIRLYLVREQRWLSPLYLAGESYGGFRVSRLARRLQGDLGITQAGLILISPALDFSLLRGNERNLWPWAALLPSYAAITRFYREAETSITPAGPRPFPRQSEAEEFALTDYLIGLATAEEDKQGWYERLSVYLGLEKENLKKWGGRVPSVRYVKIMSKNPGHILSLYDGSISIIDPSPADYVFHGMDPYLERLTAAIAVGVNGYIGTELDYRSDKPYRLLSDEVLVSWNWRSGMRGQQGYVEAVDHLKETVTINPEMRVLIIHGAYDLMTPYFASVIAVKQMRLDPQVKNNIAITVYDGGHMPYLNDCGRMQMYIDAKQFYTGE